MDISIAPESNTNRTLLHFYLSTIDVGTFTYYLQFDRILNFSQLPNMSIKTMENQLMKHVREERMGMDHI